jgi:uncharacterized protein YdaU (DUF1376 family)
MSRNFWTAFCWKDYAAKTAHLSLAEHGAYLLLMSHYYTTRLPLPANASVLHRVCRCTTDADRAAVDAILREFFTLDGEVYRHDRIEEELAKAVDISDKRRHAAKIKHGKKDANAHANQMHMHPQSQSQSQILERGNDATPGKPSTQDREHKLFLLATAHPRGKNILPGEPLPYALESGMVQAILDEGEAQGISEEDALNYLLRQTTLYAQAVAQWPEPQRRFAANLTRWFTQHEYRADPREWERRDQKTIASEGGQNGNGHKNRAEQRKLDNLKARDAARAAIMACGSSHGAS